MSGGVGGGRLGRPPIPIFYGTDVRAEGEVGLEGVF
jgi:hypothetical protein